MKENWEIKRLGEISVVNMGQSPKGSSYNTIGDGVPLINGPVEFGGNDPFSKTLKTKFTTEPTKMCKQGDLILCVRGSTTGRMNIAGFDSCIGRGVASISSAEHQEWINQYINLNRDLIYKLGTGSTFPNVSSTALSNLLIPIPPQEQQQRIVSILDETFAAIDKAKENAEKNLQNSRELFESYLQSAFANPGSGWEIKRLGEVCEISSKLIDPRKAEFIDLIHVGGANIESKKGSLIELKTAREEKLQSGKFLFDETMVLYSKIRPYLMKVALPYFRGLCSADVYPLSPVPNKINRNYLFYLLLSQKFTQYAIQGSDRAGMPKVNRNHLFDFSFCLAPLEDQECIVSKLDSLSTETKRLEAIYQQKLVALDELKKSVLQKAFNGELTGA